MSDLSEAELLAATTVHDRLKAVNVQAWVDPVALIETDRLQRAALEIQRHRSAPAADRERVIDIVEEAIDQSRDLPIGRAERAIATRVAEQLATARAGLSGRDRQLLKIIGTDILEFGIGYADEGKEPTDEELAELRDECCALIDRLLGAP